jgi:phosphate-selective porin OprO/OprP
MQKFFPTLFVFVFSLFFFETIIAQESNPYKVHWKNGLRIENADKSIKIKMGGRVQFDMMYLNQDSVMSGYFNTAGNGVEIRRARFFASGTLYKFMDFKLQIDFANNALTLKDAWLKFKHIPVVGNLKVGHLKEPTGLNTLTSSKYLTMMERPVSSYLDLDRRLGFMLYRQHLDRRLTWQLGFFYPTVASNKYVGNGYHITGRLVGLPIYQNEENQYQVLHLGVSYSHQYLDNMSYLIRLRPEAHLAPKYINIKVLDVKNFNVANFELAYIYKQFSFQAEYHMYNFTHGDTANYAKTSYSSAHYYATLSWFITGEHRNYSKKKTAFDIIRPKKSFGKEGGVGAFELAFRYSHSDFNADDFNGGLMDNYTLGLNWYMNSAVKIAANYIYTVSKSYYEGHSNIFQMRFQIAF